MWSTARTISAGDIVIVWLTRDLLQPLLITPGKDFNSRFGNYRHNDFIGVPYGSKVGAPSGKGFIHLLRPTPELWTTALPHRTQILYLADIAFITSQLNIRRGSRVIEAGKPPSCDPANLAFFSPPGTGSASFSHSVIRSVGSAGHLWSYEFHEARAAKARDEFTRHGLLDVVTLTHRNVCKDGFTVTDTADSLFLDIPAPWDAIEHAKKALRKDCITRICCFSPCMEQVLRTVSALNDAGFTDITMYETLLRPHDVSQIPALPSIDDAAEKLKRAELRREEKRLKQIAQGQRTKRKREGDEEDPDELEVKRAKTDEVTEEISIKSDEILQDLQAPNTNNKFSVSKVMSEVRGHTSYLTFACLLPDISLISSAPHH
ncbi:tRNA methyltransferase complex GCD14 subunit [Armillaria gallica]|uniref:tRNA (adenine(58)-N(1))-methyltransferase catalytic subunit TRM61 n=1 Tax=Armillaria gallica TaxID=47427 RepID=A0A2H3DQ59_ARMGA|nr:tRNA methyltransferase complex GCD14 subunit [Armillaria gallica]